MAYNHFKCATCNAYAKHIDLSYREVSAAARQASCAMKQTDDTGEGCY
jgi:hypothetical protein